MLQFFSFFSSVFYIPVHASPRIYLIMEDVTHLRRQQLPNVASLVDVPIRAATTSCERSLSWRGRTGFALPSTPRNPDEWAVSFITSYHLILPLTFASL